MINGTDDTNDWRSATPNKPHNVWIRSLEDMKSRKHYFSVTDIDWLIHKFRVSIDTVTEHAVQLMQCVEVKCFDAEVPFAQRHSLYMLHQFLYGCKLVKNVDNRPDTMIWNFGMSFLTLSGGDTPDTCAHIKWGRFDDKGEIVYRTIDLSTLLQLQKFEIRADTFAPIRNETLKRLLGRASLRAG